MTVFYRTYRMCNVVAGGAGRCMIEASENVLAGIFLDGGAGFDMECVERIAVIANNRFVFELRAFDDMETGNRVSATRMLAMLQQQNGRERSFIDFGLSERRGLSAHVELRIDFDRNVKAGAELSAHALFL